MNACPCKNPISQEVLKSIDSYWRAANYLTVGQMYLRENPLLRETIQYSQIKTNVQGYWGTVPGQNFIYAHLSRAIIAYDLNMIYIAGPGNGGGALISNSYLEGTYSEVYPEISKDLQGLQKLFSKASSPIGISSEISPAYPGCIQSGAELGYSLSHAFGAAFDNPNLIVACIIGDGEAETGPIATAWHSNKYLNPIHDGAVLPILHLNGYSSSCPSVLASIPTEELDPLLRGYGWNPLYVEIGETEDMHRNMANTLDTAITLILGFQAIARDNSDSGRPIWPMIVFRSKKGWTGPIEVDGVAVEGTFRAHHIPLVIDNADSNHLDILKDWLSSYKPEELFDENGCLFENISNWLPKGNRRMSSNPHANGGLFLKELTYPDLNSLAIATTIPGSIQAIDIEPLSNYVREIIRLNGETRNFRLFGTGDVIENGLKSVFDVTNRQWNSRIQGNDEFLAADGRIMEMLSEHQCQGWLEGYLLTGRHGIFSSSEAYINVIDSMFFQHMKWLTLSDKVAWRKEIASLNYLLTSNPYPYFIDAVLSMNSIHTQVFLPPDANCLLSISEQCLRSFNKINVVIASKTITHQWLGMTEAVSHCTLGIGAWNWASNNHETLPDLVMACCGEDATQETLAAVSILWTHLPEIKIKVVNVVDLMKLQSNSEHPHGLPDEDFDRLFTKDRPILFAFHGYPWLIHRLTYRRSSSRNLHVCGFKNVSEFATPFDSAVVNEMDRFHLVLEVVAKVPQLGKRGTELRRFVEAKLQEHKAQIVSYGVDLPEVQHWKWSSEEIRGNELSVPISPLKQLENLGQSIWIDCIPRQNICDGHLQQMIQYEGLMGIHASPSMFDSSVEENPEYLKNIQIMNSKNLTCNEIFETLAVMDVQKGADEFLSLYHGSDGKDGYVNIEINPYFAHNAEATIAEAKRLWAKIDRPNIYIKIPGTEEGLLAIQELISEGVNVNVTLLFGLTRYRRVVEAYLSGLDARILQGKPIKQIQSIASIFVNRIDDLVDSVLKVRASENASMSTLILQLSGTIGIAQAKMAYQIYKSFYTGERFKQIESQGGRTQRLHWASTETTNPGQSDVKYVEALIGQNTITSVSQKTLCAYLDHGSSQARIEDELKAEFRLLERLQEFGVSMEEITKDLEEQGISKLKKTFNHTIGAIINGSGTTLSKL